MHYDLELSHARTFPNCHFRLLQFRGRVGHLLKPELAENDDFLLRWLRGSCVCVCHLSNLRYAVTPEPRRSETEVVNFFDDHSAISSHDISIFRMFILFSLVI